MEKYLEQGEVAPEQLHAPLREGAARGHLIPGWFYLARNGAGIEASPLALVNSRRTRPRGKRRRFEGEGAEAQEFYAVPGPKAVLAHVFRCDRPFIGKVGIFRVHQGTVTPNTPLFVGDAGAVQVGHLFTIQGKDYVETDALVPGEHRRRDQVEEIEFAACCTIRTTRTHHLRPLEFRCDHGIAVENQERRRRAALFEVLHKLEMETRASSSSATPHQRDRDPGLGRAAHARQARQDAAAVQDGALGQAAKIPYRETVTRVAEGHAGIKTDRTARGSSAKCPARRTAAARKGYEFVDKVKGGVIPNTFIPAVEKACAWPWTSGVIAGYPVHASASLDTTANTTPWTPRKSRSYRRGAKPSSTPFQKREPSVAFRAHGRKAETPPDKFMGDLTNFQAAPCPIRCVSSPPIKAWRRACETLVRSPMNLSGAAISMLRWAQTMVPAFERRR